MLQKCSSPKHILGLRNDRYNIKAYVKPVDEHNNISRGYKLLNINKIY